MRRRDIITAFMASVGAAFLGVKRAEAKPAFDFDALKKDMLDGKREWKRCMGMHVKDGRLIEVLGESLVSSARDLPAIPNSSHDSYARNCANWISGKLRAYITDFDGARSICVNQTVNDLYISTYIDA